MLKSSLLSRWMVSSSKMSGEVSVWDFVGFWNLLEDDICQQCLQGDL